MALNSAIAHTSAGSVTSARAQSLGDVDGGGGGATCSESGGVATGGRVAVVDASNDVGTVVEVTSTVVGTQPAGMVAEFDDARTVPAAGSGSVGGSSAGPTAFSEPIKGTIAANPAADAAVTARRARRAGCDRRRNHGRRASRSPRVGSFMSTVVLDLDARVFELGLEFRFGIRLCVEEVDHDRIRPVMLDVVDPTRHC